MIKNRLIILVLVAFGVLSCGRYSQPRPYGYYRIEVPDYSYRLTSLKGYPYQFEHAEIAYIDTAVDHAEPYWVDVVYPTLNARIHCSYKHIPGHEDCTFLFLARRADHRCMDDRYTSYARGSDVFYPFPDGKEDPFLF